MDTGLLILAGIGIYAYLKSKKQTKDPREKRLDAFFAELEAKGMTMEDWLEQKDATQELKDIVKDLWLESGFGKTQKPFKS